MDSNMNATVPMQMAGGYPPGGYGGPPGGGFPPPGGGGYGGPPGGGFGGPPGGGFGGPPGGGFPPPGGGGFGGPPQGGFGPPGGGGFGPPPGGGFGGPPMGGSFGAPGSRVVYQGTGGSIAGGMFLGVLLPVIVAYAIFGGGMAAGAQMRGDSGQVVTALAGIVGGIALLVAGLFAGNKMISLYWDNIVIEGKRCQYRGSVGELFKALIVPYILTAFTAGIYTPWLIKRMREYVYANVDVQGERLEFHGNAGELLVKFLIFLAIYLVGSIVIVGPFIALPWITNEVASWEWNNTSISGRPFRYQATLVDTLVNVLLSGLLSGCTLYIGIPWGMAMRWQYETQHVS